jgi:hypothetical protein
MSHKQIFLFVCILLLIAAGCGPKKKLTPETVELEPLEFTEEDGTATLRYQHTVDVEWLNASTDEIFTLSFPIDKNDPKAVSLMLAVGDGVQMTRFSSLTPGGVCYITIKHTASYDIKGLFKPSSCSFEIKIEAKVKDAQILSDECTGGGFQIPSPSAFFYPPPQDTLPISGGLQPVKLSPDPGVTVVITLSDVVVPESTGCQW